MAVRPTLTGPVVFVLAWMVIAGLGPVAAEAAPDTDRRIRVALEAAAHEAEVTSHGPVRVAAAGWSTTVTGPVRVRRVGAHLIVNDRTVAPPVRITGTSAWLSVDGTPVRGDLVVTVRGRRVLVVNEVGLEDYVRSVVPSEVPSDWPPEALKAQAILARTYALYQKSERGARDFDLDATVQSQVYGGVANEDGRTSRAVAATAGRVVRFQGQLAFTPYHSTSAGPTEDAAEIWGIDLPYLKGVDCAFDSASPASRWTRRVPLDEIEASLGTAGYRVGPIASITPLGRNRSGRVSAVRVVHAGGALILKGEDLRRIIGYRRLPSMRFDLTAFAINPETRRVEAWFEGGGWGHGVGLCQWGMKAQAERGWTADQIVGYYYPGTIVDVVAPRAR